MNYNDDSDLTAEQVNKLDTAVQSMSECLHLGQLVHQVTQYGLSPFQSLKLMVEYNAACNNQFLEELNRIEAMAASDRK